MRTLLAFALVFASLSATGAAAEPSKNPDKRPDQLARDLGSPVFAVRDRASRELWKLGAAARPALEAAARSEMPEVAQRAADILEKFDWGVYPDTPTPLLKLIKDFRSNEIDRQLPAVAGLLKGEDRGIETLGLLLAHDLDGERRDQIFQHLLTHTRDAVPALVFREKLDKAERLLELGTFGPNPEAWLDYAVFMHQRGKLKDAAVFLERATQLRTDRAGFSAAVLAVVQQFDGKGAAAAKRMLAVPKEALPPHMRASFLEEAGAWSELANESIDGEMPHFGLNLFRQRKVGNTEKVNQLIAEAKRSGSEIGGEVSADVGLALLLNERPVEGIEVLREKKAEPRLLADVLAGRLMFDEVLQLLTDGPPPADDGWEARRRVYYDMRKARVLAQLGRKDESVQLFNQIAETVRDRDSYAVRELLRAELRSGRFDLAAEHAGQLLAKIESREYGGFDASPDPFELLFEEDAEAAQAWWRAFRKFSPVKDEQPGATMRRVREVVTGRATPERLAEAKKAMAAWQGENAKPAGSMLNRVRIHRALALVARHAGDWDEAEKQLREAAKVWSVETPDDGNDGSQTLRVIHAGGQQAGPKAWMYGTDETFKVWLDLGELLTHRGKHAEAAQVFQLGWNQYPRNPILLYLSGRSLAAADDKKEGQRRIDAAHRIALGDAQVSARFLHELCERGHMADARKARDATLKGVWYWTPMRGNVWNQIGRCSLMLKEYDAAATAIERNLHFLLKTPNVVFVDGIGYVTVPTNVRANRARAKLAAGKADEAFADAKEILTLLPGHAEFLIAVVPEFEKLNRTKEADELFAMVWKTFRKLTADNPESGWAHASAAFAAAGCRRELDAALVHAKKAVELEPDLKWHQEVLAEVLFRRGDRIEAIDVIDKLRVVEYRSHYYKRLRDRYLSGDIASPLPLAPDED